MNLYPSLNIVVAPLPKEALSIRNLKRGVPPDKGYDLINLELFGLYRFLVYPDDMIVHWYPDGKPSLWENNKKVFVPPMMEYSGIEAKTLLANLNNAHNDLQSLVV